MLRRSLFAVKSDIRSHARTYRLDFFRQHIRISRCVYRAELFIDCVDNILIKLFFGRYAVADACFKLNRI